MRKTIFFHLGTYKTGTSSIQHTLYREEASPSPRFLFPRSGLIADEPEVGYRHTHLWLQHGNPQWEEIVEDVLQEIENSPLDSVFLSAEGWARLSNIEALDQLTQRFRSRGHTLVGICYFRNIFSYARSIYREFVLRRSVKSSFGTFVADRTLFNYPAIAAGLRRIFTEDMIFRVHDSRRDIVDDFFKITIGGCSRRPNGDRANQTALTAAGAELCRQMNLRGVDPGWHLEEQTQLLWETINAIPDTYASERFPDKGLVFSKQEVAAFSEATGLAPAAIEAVFEPPDITSRHDISYIYPLIEKIACTLHSKM